MAAPRWRSTFEIHSPGRKDLNVVVVLAEHLRRDGYRCGSTHRKSIAERYTGRGDYLGRYKQAIDELIQQRWILDEDRPALMQRGELEWSEATR